MLPDLEYVEYWAGILRPKGVGIVGAHGRLLILTRQVLGLGRVRRDECVVQVPGTGRPGAVVALQPTRRGGQWGGHLKSKGTWRAMTPTAVCRGRVPSTNYPLNTILRPLGVTRLQVRPRDPPHVF